MQGPCRLDPLRLAVNHGPARGNLRAESNWRAAILGKRRALLLVNETGCTTFRQAKQPGPLPVRPYKHLDDHHFAPSEPLVRESTVSRSRRRRRHPLIHQLEAPTSTGKPCIFDFALFGRQEGGAVSSEIRSRSSLRTTRRHSLNGKFSTRGQPGSV